MYHERNIFRQFHITIPRLNNQKHRDEILMFYKSRCILSIPIILFLLSLNNIRIIYKEQRDPNAPLSLKYNSPDNYRSR